MLATAFGESLGVEGPAVHELHDEDRLDGLLSQRFLFLCGPSSRREEPLHESSEPTQGRTGSAGTLAGALILSALGHKFGDVF